MVTQRKVQYSDIQKRNTARGEIRTALYTKEKNSARYNTALYKRDKKRKVKYSAIYKRDIQREVKYAQRYPPKAFEGFTGGPWRRRRPPASAGVWCLKVYGV